MFTFAIKFDPISRTQLFGSTQTGIRFGACKVRRLNRAKENKEEVKNKSQMYIIKKGIEEIKNNSQVNITQEGIKEFKSYPQVNITKVVREDVKKQPSGIHCLRGHRRE